MTVAEWLDSRTPVPPSQLTGRMRVALSESLGSNADELDEVCLEAAERLLAEVLREGCHDRRHALDLLAADALVAYALEGASERSADIDLYAERAMTRIAAIAAAVSA